MINRRKFINYSVATSLGVIASGSVLAFGDTSDAQPEDFDQLDVTPGHILAYDIHMMALYMDGTLGPKTGIFKAEYLLQTENLEFQFWHGHGGKQHRFIVTQSHMKLLKKNQKVTIETNSVDNHKHKLFIDPSNAKWRVPGATPIEVPVDPAPGEEI